LDELTTAIKNYIVDTETRLSKSIADGDKAVSNLLLADIDKLKAFQDLLDKLDGDLDGEPNLQVLLTAVQDDVNTNAKTIADLKALVSGKLEEFKNVLEDISTLKQSQSEIVNRLGNHDLVFDSLASGLQDLADTIKSSTAKFTIKSTDNDDDSSDDNAV
jgi:small-conductance mechanosensitive channel